MRTTWSASRQVSKPVPARDRSTSRGASIGVARRRRRRPAGGRGAGAPPGAASRRPSCRARPGAMPSGRVTSAGARVCGGRRPGRVLGRVAGLQAEADAPVVQQHAGAGHGDVAAELVGVRLDQADRHAVARRRRRGTWSRRRGRGRRRRSGACGSKRAAAARSRSSASSAAPSAPVVEHVEPVVGRPAGPPPPAGGPTPASSAVGQLVAGDQLGDAGRGQRSGSPATAAARSRGRGPTPGAPSGSTQRPGRRPGRRR